MNQPSQMVPGTILWIAPFYNRSGFGVDARAAVSALHQRGIRIRTLAVDMVEPGIDDCDLDLIKSLEATPLIPPITAIISHVPNRIWLGLELPEPNLRILATTVFDCSAEGGSLPAEMLAVCREMDQIWIMTEKERQAFIAAGFPPEKIQIVRWPHSWLENPLLPPPSQESSFESKPFRFLSISLFLPRRRWDTLIEAFFEEFKENENVELYLKVNYPSWHPVSDKPRQDLHELVLVLRQKTGSTASIIVDEELGTRTDIVRLIDSCHAYVSTDTAPTSPVAEARVRQRLVIIPSGLYGPPEPNLVEIAVDPDATMPLTQEMLLYQPNHKGASMPLLHVQDVRNALCRAFNMSLEEKQLRCKYSAQVIPGPSDTIPKIIDAIFAGWKYKNEQPKTCVKKNEIGIVWEGSQFVYHSLALINRELCLQLIDAGYEVSIQPYEPDQFSEEVDPRFHKLSHCVHVQTTRPVDVHVRHKWPPNLTPPKEGHWVIIQPWEFGSLPKQWVEVFLTQVDECWVPSEYLRQVYVESGVPAERVVVVPNGINPDKFHPGVKPIKLKTKKKFKFLFVGGAIARKGVDLLLQAYFEAFKNNDDVCLIIKDLGSDSFYKGLTFKEHIKKLKKRKNVPAIEYIDKSFPEEELAGLYKACDVLVHPYRGEGFGLPILEAMACGIPAVVTHGGACLDFCNRENSLLVKAKKILFPEKKVEYFETVGFPWLYEVDLNDLKEKMRYANQHSDEMKRLGVKASRDAVNNWTWNRSAQIVEQRVQFLKQAPIKRFTNQANTAHGASNPQLSRQTETERNQERDFDSASAGTAASVDALYNKGRALIQMGKLVEGLRVLSLVLDREHHHLETLKLMSQIYKKLGKHAEAQQILELAHS